MKMLKLVSFCLLTILASFANANVVWNWSFDSEAGQFITDGDSTAAGTYHLIDFSVISSGSGGTIGSLSNGTYGTNNMFSTLLPFSFEWDGSHVTQWLHSGGNTFDWWAFSDAITATDSMYVFGWEAENINNPAQAGHWAGLDTGFVAAGEISVASVPVPAAAWLFGSAALGLVGAARKRH